MNTAIAEIDIQERQAQYELDVYGKRGPSLVRGEGAYLWDDAGRRYTDLMAGIGVAALGHAHPRLVQAVTEQVGRLMSCPGAFANDQKAAYLQRLAAVTPGDLNRIFLCNSGTEAVEAALKFARIHTGRDGIIATKRAFHGRTYGAASIGGTPKHTQGCGPLLPECRHIAYNDIWALEEAVDENTAAVVLEVIQGEGGVRPATTNYLRAARRICDRHGALLIFDEVQTGFCRTGRWFASQHHDVEPDMLCLAKAIAGGFPMGAVAVSEDIEAPLGRHGSTFGGNPLACAAALAVIDEMERENLAARAAMLGGHAMERLSRADCRLVREIRGQGLMIGLELRAKVRPILQQLQERGIIALPAGPLVLRLLPPLTIEQNTLDRALDVVIDVLGGSSD